MPTQTGFRPESRITVIGAGVMGLTTALALAEAGVEVDVLERSDTLGAESCSRFAGGMLAPWCEGETAEPLVVGLGQEALDYWPARVPGVVRHGSLVVATRRDRTELDRFARRTSGHETVDAARLAALEPDLAGRFDRGLFFPREAHLDPRLALPALAAQLAKAGGRLHLGIADGDRPEAAIDCRGLAARDRLPDLRGVRGEMLILRCPDVTLSRPVRLLHPRFPLYIVPRADSHFMVGATMIESDARHRATARSVSELIAAAYTLHPAFADAEVVEIGCDARPAFPDNLPRIRRIDRTLFVNGLFRHGFLLSPALARMAAAVVTAGAHFPEVMHEDIAQRRSA